MPKIYFLGPEEVIHQLQLDVEQPANWLNIPTIKYQNIIQGRKENIYM
jgi:hypothetical protein